MSITRPAAEAASILLSTMIEMCQDPLARQVIGIPEGMIDPKDIEPFYVGIECGLGLAQALLNEMGTQTAFTLVEMQQIVDTLGDIKETSND